METDTTIKNIIYLFIIFGFSSLVLNYLSHVCWNTSRERQIKHMREELYKSIIRQDMSFFDQNSSGELCSIFNENVEIVKNAIGFKFSEFIHLICRGLGCLIFSIVQAWKFSLVYVSIIPFVVGSNYIMFFFTQKYSIKELDSYEKASKIAQEALSSIRTVLCLGLQESFLKNYDKFLMLGEKISIQKGLTIGFFNGLTSFFSNIFFAVGVYYGVYLVKYECDQFLPANIIQSFFALFTTTFAISQALPFLKELAEAKSAAKKILDITGTKSDIDVFDQKSTVQLENLKGEIEFDNVFFSYQQKNATKILNGLSFKIPAGKTVALVGPSGGGKSTIVSLLQRFYLPSAGSIKLDGHRIEDLDLNLLRSQTALVSQEPILFTKTIRENIRLGRLDASDQDIENVAKNANAHDFIMEMTNKYDTQVGERGTKLSGGQKQRIAIARGLIRNPKILFLDEATSALDYESEQIVQDALDKAKVGRTTIIIAHRLRTIRNADIIFYVSGGVLIEKGTHDELMEKKGEYFNLVQVQKKSYEESENDSENFQKTSENILNLDSIEDNLNLMSVNDKEKKKKLNKKKIPFYYEYRLFKLHAQDWLWLSIGSICLSIYAMIQPVTSLFFSEIFELFEIQDEENQKKGSLIFMGIIISLGVLSIISSIGNSLSFSLSESRITRKIRHLMFKSMLKQEMGFHDNEENNSSILTSKLSSSASICKELTCGKLKVYVQGVAGVGFSIIISMVINWKLALIMLIFVPISFISGLVIGRTSTNKKVNGNDFNEEQSRIAIETVENIKTIISFGREKYFISEFNSIYVKKFRKTLILLHVQALFYSISNSVLFFVRAAAFNFGYYLIKSNELDVSDLFKVFPMITFSSLILAKSYSQLSDQNLASRAAKTSFKIIDRESKIDNFSDEGLKPVNFIGDIKFENVHFRYPNRPNIKILNGFNLEINNRTINALVGPSGCGKSTTIALLLRFYDVESGIVYLDGIDIRKLNINWLRSHIGLVSQEPVLFNLSIFENICMGDIEREKIEMNEVVEVAINSNIHFKIESLPEKYNTVVGSKGGQLSGGEKQRVAIARALIRSPKILLLDEATSALDNQSECIVQDALFKAQQNRTCIVVAHKLSTIVNSNKITVIKDGFVLEEGSHDKLMQNKNFYYKLQTQKN